MKNIPDDIKGSKGEVLAVLATLATPDEVEIVRRGGTWESAAIVNKYFEVLWGKLTPEARNVMLEML